MENNEFNVVDVDMPESSGSLSLVLNLIYRNLVFVIICIIFCGFLGFGANRLFYKPKYTASVKVMFITNITDNDSGDMQLADISLAKIYLPETARLIKSADFASAATKIYQQKYKGASKGIIESSSIKVQYDANVLIFTIGYTDYDEEEAKKKLLAVVDSANENLPKSIQAKDVSIKETQSPESITPVQSNVTFLYVFLGVVAGVVIVILKLFLSYSLDNSIRSKKDLERITGANLIATIERRGD